MQTLNQTPAQIEQARRTRLITNTVRRSWCFEQCFKDRRLDGSRRIKFRMKKDRSIPAPLKHQVLEAVRVELSKYEWVDEISWDQSSSSAGLHDYLKVVVH